MSRPFHQTSMAETIQDTPVAKRQKVYNEEDDDGDELFQDLQLDSPTQHITQPTQIINYPQSNIQVPASSPFRSAAALPTLPTSSPAQKLPQQRVGGALANMMAPAGTVFRNPNTGVQKVTIDLSDDDGPIYRGSSDDDTTKNGNIKPSAFRRSSKSSFESADPFAAASSGSNNGKAKFNNIIANAIHKPGSAPSKTDPVGMLYDPRKSKSATKIDLTKLDFLDGPVTKQRADAMSSGYGSRPKPKIQSRPEKPQPVKDLTLQDITDKTMKDKIERMRNVFPSASVLMCRDALLVHRGNFDDAAASMLDKDLVNLVSDDEDELAEVGDLLKKSTTTTKRGIDKVIAIKDRYGGAVTAPPKKTQPVATPPKPKRRLMQGRKHVSSPVQAPSPKPPTPVINIDSDAEGYDSGIASGSEVEVDYDLEGRVLKLLNKCQPGELVDLAGITKDTAEKFLAQRPFRSIDIARNTRDNTKTKGGKASTRVPMGDRIVEAAMNMTRGYEAVDNLVDQCNKIARPLKAEMGKWGFDVFGSSKSGELELTSLGDEDDNQSLRDSGIGTPSSVSASQHDGEDEVRPVTRKERASKFLQKPANMRDTIVLKDYQVVGLNWLALLYDQKLSCILADEMGLGKTCQVIAFLSHLATTGISGPHLVIVPGSTLENWLREFEQFSPGLVAVPYHGKQTERQDMADNILNRREEINVVVTTYDMAFKKQDNSFLKKLRPKVCVYDEGHLLKNPLSKRYTSLVRIPAEFRLLLTGTPLQNNLQELAALLGFILPDVFQKNYEELEFIFKHRAKTTDSDHSALLSSQRMDRARQMLAPFVLRRKKYQVLKHLPTKLCRVEYCDMHPVQKELYRGYEEPARERAKLRLEGVKPVVKSKADLKSDDNNPFMQLRKAAIHPQLFRRHFDDKKIEKMASILQRHYPDFNPDGPKGPGTGYKTEYLLQEMKSMSDFILHKWCQEYPAIGKFDIEENSWMESGKVEALIRLVKKYKANGDRVLIFSQFTKVLDILEAVLNSIDVYFTRIDGSTDISSRQPLIDQFRDDDSITAFLLTTKAGGTGLNLMMANKVIIFDASLNPQDDVQAENRAHRVGQTRDVEVVRLVTKKTIDELILKLGESKLALDRGVAGDEDTKADEAGEADVERMLLEGLGGKNEDDTETKEKEKTEVKGKERQTSTSGRVGAGRKQSIFLSRV